MRQSGKNTVKTSEILQRQVKQFISKCGPINGHKDRIQQLNKKGHYCVYKSNFK